MFLGASGTDFGGPGAPIWEDLASILSKRFHVILFHTHDSIPFHAIPLHSIPFHSIACGSITFDSIPFHCHFTSRRSGVPGFRNSRVGCYRDTDLLVSRPRDSNRPRRDSRSVNNTRGSSPSVVG